MNAPGVIWVVGSLHMDMVFQTPRFPVPGETLAGPRWQQRCGGKGRNQAVSAIRFAPSVRMVGAVGADAFGVMLVRSLRDVGVDTDLVARVDGDTSGASVALVEPGGDTECVIVSAVNLRIPSDAVDALGERVRPGDVVLLQNEVVASTNARVAEIASAAGATIILNGAPYRPVVDSLKATVTHLVLNEVEAAQYAGLASVTAANVGGVLGSLLVSWRCAAIVITLGAGGVAYQCGGHEPVHIQAYAIAARDTLGAGDAFVGALAGRILVGCDVDRAVRYANAAAAATIAVPFAERGSVGPAEVATYLTECPQPC